MMALINKISLNKIVLVFVIPLFLFSACTQINLYEKNISIPNLKWLNNFNASGTFSLVDTNTNYNVYLVLRHTDAYMYNNIWLNVGLQIPGDSMKYQKLNIPLGADATGWYGIGMNDIWEHRKLLATLPLKKGNYNFNISQIMRDNPLLHVMSVGLRIEKR
ncbi:MAG: gliding motility lipoprotein GldH [Ferruginibacter sp.]|nr:gliding motility lipoprotein GldH [Ferruginibacter sp.]